MNAALAGFGMSERLFAVCMTIQFMRQSFSTNEGLIYGSAKTARYCLCNNYE